MNERTDLPTTDDPMPGRLAFAVGFAGLGPPVAWALHLNLTYFLVQPVCLTGGDALLHVSGLVALPIALAALATAIGLLARHRAPFRQNVEGFDGWQAFVGLFGIASGVIFSLAIIAQWSTVFVIDACAG